MGWWQALQRREVRRVAVTSGMARERRLRGPDEPQESIQPRDGLPHHRGVGHDMRAVHDDVTLAVRGCVPAKPRAVSS